MSFSELKENARQSLKGHYKDAILMIIIMGAVASVVGVIAGALDKSLGLVQTNQMIIGNQIIEYKTGGVISGIASVVVTGLFAFGMLNFYLKLSRNESAELKDLFSKFNMIITYLVLTFIMGLFIGLWSLLLIIPGIIASFSYSQTYLIQLDNPDMGYLDAIKKSKELMKGHKWEYFLLNLSFIGWIILGVFTFGILYFWLVPYISVTQCNFYNKLIEK